MPHFLAHPLAVIFFSFLLGAVSGCGGPKIKEASNDPVQIQLEKIGNAYMLATQHLNRPPSKWEEINSVLAKTGKADEIRKSVGDKEPFEIVYGVELRMLKAEGNAIPIVAFEKTGADGVRYVLRGRDEVLKMSASQLKSATFPKGFNLPF